MLAAQAVSASVDEVFTGLNAVGTVHFARFDIIGGNLCMLSVYDGDFTTYIRDFITLFGNVFDTQVAADAAGLEELWLWEDCFRESGLAPAAAVLAWTERIRVGVGLYPVPLRNVALTAMELASVERLFPGRHIVGVGHGVQEWMGQVGARVESPVTLLREPAPTVSVPS